MTVNFTILGEPQGKERPRFARDGGRIRTYTPKNTSDYEHRIGWEYRRKYGVKRFADDAELCLTVRAYFSIPQRTSKPVREKMRCGSVRPTKKPDADNILKAVADGLNSVAYRDDKQIVTATVEKRYSEIPRVEVEVCSMNPLSGYQRKD